MADVKQTVGFLIRVPLFQGLKKRQIENLARRFVPREYDADQAIVTQDKGGEGFFIIISGKEKTTRIPKDEIHTKFFPIVHSDGKKAAEKFCGECHKPDGVPFPDDHPPKFRCLFCHKLDE